MIYLDNAATTWPKPSSVLKEMNRCLKHYAANPGRGGYDMVSRAGEAVYKCRCAVCDLVGLDNPENVIFTSNATHALNIAIKGTVRSGGHVIITSVEHNSVLRPVHSLGASYDIARADIFGYVSADEVERLIRDNTCLIVCTLASNVCGSVQPFEKIAAIAKKHSIPFLLDASQGLGAVNVDMNKMNIDMLAAPGHKGLYGPTGTGILCLGGEYIPLPLTEGGTGSNSKEPFQPIELPDRLESGTLNVVGIAGLMSGVNFVLKTGADGIAHKENRLADMLAADLLSIHGVRLAGYKAAGSRIGVLSAVIDGMDCVDAASRLNSDYHIAVRSGYHCSYIAHETIGTAATGTIRFSFGAFNTIDEVKRTAFAVSRIAKRLYFLG